MAKLGRAVYLTLAVLVPDAVVHAQPTPEARVELNAELPEPLQGCVSAELLRDAYQRVLAANGGSAAAQPTFQLSVRLRARPGATPDTTSLELEASETGRPLGRRALPVRGGDCAALPDALALVLVLLSRDAAQAVVAPPPSAAEVVRPVPAPAVEPPPAVEPSPTRGESVEIGAGAGALFGALPDAALALQLQAATVGELLSFRVRAGFLWPQERDVAEGSIQMRGYELAVEVCPNARFSSLPGLVLRLCAGPRFGLVHARGRDFAVRNERADEFLLYFGLLPEASLRLGGATWLQLSAGAALALVRPRFGVGLGSEQRWFELTGPGALRAELGLSLVQIF